MISYLRIFIQLHLLRDTPSLTTIFCLWDWQRAAIERTVGEDSRSSFAFSLSHLRFTRHLNDLISITQLFFCLLPPAPPLNNWNAEMVQERWFRWWSIYFLIVLPWWHKNGTEGKKVKLERQAKEPIVTNHGKEKETFARTTTRWSRPRRKLGSGRKRRRGWESDSWFGFVCHDSCFDFLAQESPNASIWNSWGQQLSNKQYPKVLFSAAQ